MKQICKVIDCRKDVHARLMCVCHYKKWHWRVGRKNRKFVECSEDNCNKMMHAKNLCYGHYRQLSHVKNTRRRYVEGNKDLINEQQRERRKRNPELYLKIEIKYLRKISKTLGISLYKYKYILTLWARAVKKRDGKCMRCESTRNLHAHHVVLKSMCPDMALDIENGLTLCEKCHKKEHCAYPEKDVRRNSDKRN